MNKLNKMLVRELLKSKGQFFAAAAVIFAGITMFTATYIAYRNLTNSVDTYYEKYKFTEYSAGAQTVTPSVVQQIKTMKGVKTAEGRITREVAADMGGDKRITLKLVSMPDEGTPAVNNIYLISGRYFDSRASHSCLVNEKFAQYHNLSQGSAVRAIINRQIFEFKVDGIAGSPEFLYAIKPGGSIYSSAADYGIVFVKESTARNILDYDGHYNEVHVIFQQGADRKAIIQEIEKKLKPYGFISGTERKDQVSDKMIRDEFKQLEQMSVIFPVLFLSVAAMIIYIMQRRIISNQRTLIGVMKAFGYTDARILTHYVQNSLLIAFAGSLPAVFVGVWMGGLLTETYKQLYSIPVLTIKLYWSVIFFGVGLSTFFCLLAGYNSAKRVLGIQPAQSMRAEAPRSGKRIFLEKFAFLWGRLTFGWKVSIRNMFRSRQRSFITLLGTAFTVMFFMISLFLTDAMDFLLNQHFFKFQQQDYKVSFSGPAAWTDAKELEHIDGIRRVEPLMEIPVELRKDWKKKELLMVGLHEGTSLYTLTDTAGKRQKVPEGGVLVAHVLAESFSIKPGDILTVKSQWGSAKEKKVIVSGITRQYAGVNCYMNSKDLGELLEEGNFATGALLSVKPGWDEKIKKELFKIPGIEYVEGRLSGFKVFLEYMNLIYTFIGLMILFGSVMGFAITFNTTVINIMERRRELASLKVLGYTRREIENTIFRENMCLGIAALLPGILLGRAMCAFIAQQFSSDLIVLDVVIYPRTYLITICSVIIFIILAQFANKKNISGLDMVEVLKNREG